MSDVEDSYQNKPMNKGPEDQHFVEKLVWVCDYLAEEHTGGDLPGQISQHKRTDPERRPRRHPKLTTIDNPAPTPRQTKTTLQLPHLKYPPIPNPDH